MDEAERNTSRGLASAAVICGFGGILTVGVGAAIGVIPGVMSIARAREDRTGILYPWFATVLTSSIALAWPLLIGAFLWDMHVQHPGGGDSTTDLLAVPAIQITATLVTLLVVKIIQRSKARLEAPHQRRRSAPTTP